MAQVRLNRLEEGLDAGLELTGILAGVVGGDMHKRNAGLLGGLLRSLDSRQQIGVILLGLDELVVVADLGLQARGQRVRKRQPEGGSIGLGISP